MAIQFPPINPGDPQPVDGDTWLYLETQEEFVCHRSSPTEAAQWVAVGTLKDSGFVYRGTLQIQQTAPAPVDTGNLYSVADGGLADPSFTGLAGTQVDQWSLIIYNGPDWVLVNTNGASGSPWVRTANGSIQPLISTDNLDMDQGNYLIDELDELQ